MLIKVLKSKILRAAVTETNLEYTGSVTVDQDLTDAVGLREQELVLVANINNGTRHETYVQLGKKGSGVICLMLAAPATTLQETGRRALGTDDAVSHRPS